MTVGLGREDIRTLFEHLSQELAERGAKGELFLVGGGGHCRCLRCCALYRGP